MRKIIPIVFLIVLGTLSYGAFLVVQGEKRQVVYKENESLKAEIKAKNDQIRDIHAKYQVENDRLRDAFIIMFPSHKEVIEKAFLPPTTSPSTQPSTVPSN